MKCTVGDKMWALSQFTNSNDLLFNKNLKYLALNNLSNNSYYASWHKISFLQIVCQ